MGQSGRAPLKRCPERSPLGQEREGLGGQVAGRRGGGRACGRSEAQGFARAARAGGRALFTRISFALQVVTVHWLGMQNEREFTEKGAAWRWARMRFMRALLAACRAPWLCTPPLLEGTESARRAALLFCVAGGPLWRCESPALRPSGVRAARIWRTWGGGVGQGQICRVLGPEAAGGDSARWRTAQSGTWDAPSAQGGDHGG